MQAETGARPPYDEMHDPEGRVRPGYAAVAEAVDSLSGRDLRARLETLESSYLDQGITFDHAGEERPFPLDLVPRVITAEQWDPVSHGVAQRVRALEALLADVYGARKVVDDGVLPLRLIASSAGFQRAVHGIQPGNGVRIHVAGIDLIRDEEGGFRVLEDNVRVPSGVSYVLTNRYQISQLMPEAFSAQPVRSVHDYPARLLSALRASSPVADPNVVLLTPGVFNSAYFEHTLLARAMGIELVEGRDLVCQRGKVYMRTTAGLRKVDVIYRRIDDEFLDPVYFRHDSLLGCPGLMAAVRAGQVVLANAVGNGVADDKLVYSYVPDLIRYYLSEEPILANVDTWRLDDPEALEEVLDRLDELVVKPVDGSGGKGIVMGPSASLEELSALRSRLKLDPRGWIAQPLVQLSTVPTVIGDTLAPRHVDLRPFALNDGNDVWVLPGGLTRVALPEGQLVVNSSQGGGSKDTWVVGQGRTVADEPTPAPPAAIEVDVPASPSLDPGPGSDWPEHQQQHEQQQQDVVGGGTC